MKKVLWFSRHEMSLAQKIDLNRIFGEMEIIHVSKTIDSGFDLQYEINEADVIAIVAPINIQQQILKIAGSKPVIYGFIRKNHCKRRWC